ncbi:MAG: sialate O-acetylesterase, partial [Armatimonadota bacterium]|nr:sialate O-acetylesterase [Armatimonadota bacterium]
MKIPQLLCGLLVYVGVSPVYADVHLPALFADNMVLQRETPIPIWGKADPGEKVTITLDGDQATTTAAADGRWQVALRPHAAGGPYALTVSGTMTDKNTLTCRNVLVGDVWLCGGQSNMEFTLKRASNAAEAIAASADPDLRLFKVRTAKPSAPADDVAGSWNAAGPDTTGRFSAIGYFFGHAIRTAEHVPIGLISSNVGGTPAQSWT